MNSDEDKFCMELVVFDEVYNFVVQTFFIRSHLGAKKWYTVEISVFQYPDLDNISIFLSLKMTSNEKSFNHKVVDLVESYKFRIKFISIRAHTKKLQFLKTDWP
jgi:hypothetical protein